MALLVCWLAILAAGFGVIFHYEQAAGTTGVAPKSWPKTASIQLDTHQNTLLFFAHPQCPCTRASVEELNHLLARCSGKVSAHAFFVKSSPDSTNSSPSSLWKALAEIPNVHLHEDWDGKEAKLFGSETSGYVMLYSPDGRLLFNGGITASRGHAGDNAGEEALLAMISNQKAQLDQTPVYGCSLFNTCNISAQSKPNE